MMDVPVMNEPAEQADCASHALTDVGARADVLNRLKRAEGQLRGIQRMIESNEDCMKIAQQFSAVRKALDSTYVRMTLCYVEQHLHDTLGQGASPAPEPQLGEMLQDIKTLLDKIR